MIDFSTKYTNIVVTTSCNILNIQNKCLYCTNQSTSQTDYCVLNAYHCLITFFVFDIAVNRLSYNLKETEYFLLAVKHLHPHLLDRANKLLLLL